MMQASAAYAQPTVGAWRAARAAIVDELMELVSCPTSPATTPTCGGTPTSLDALFAQARVHGRDDRRPGSPVVFATLDVPRPRGTLTFYIHYDGQPVDADRVDALPAVRAVPVQRRRRRCRPTRRDKTFDPEWRIYGRSAADDKAPIVARAERRRGAKATGRGPAWNLRVVLDGEEEAGSANFRRFATARPTRSRPISRSRSTGRGTRAAGRRVYFGVRGGAGADPHRLRREQRPALGNYGNWAPDPSMRLATPPRQHEGRRRAASPSPDFYDDVTPLTPTERAGARRHARTSKRR